MRRVLIVLFVLAAGLGSAATGAAQEAPGVLLIMDASGSMNRTIDGVTLLETAKDGLREMVDRLPQDARVGLRVYGHRASSDDPQAVGCEDTQLIVPVGPLDREEILGAIDDYAASGWTPIGLSLQEAVGDLGEAGGTIVLVSDGEDTCPPPRPCEVARQLAQEGYITRVHTVGLALQDEAAADQLQCVADATGGSFTNVDNVDFLLDSLSGVVAGAVEGFERPYVLGSVDRSSAPVLQWGAAQGIPQWLEAGAESAIQTGETRWVAVDVTEEGSAFAASAVIDWQPGALPDEYLEVRILDGDGAEIGVPHEVAGVIVELPQRMYLADAAEWQPSSEGWLPGAMAVVDPPSMFPAWEADEDWFQPTVERFREAGLNGGIYELWKSYMPSEPLPVGRYYVGVTWSAGREGVSRMEIGLTSYPVDAERRGWLQGRLQASHLIIEPFATKADEPVVLDLLPGSGGVAEPLGTLGRSAEVWYATTPGDPVDFEFGMGEGEHVFVGRDVVMPRAAEDADAVVELRGPDGSVVDGSDEYGPMGFGHSDVFTAPTSGTHTLTARLAMGTAADAAIALAIHVFEPMTDERGTTDDGTTDDGTTDDGTTDDDTTATSIELPESVGRAMAAGLAAVRDAVG